MGKVKKEFYGELSYKGETTRLVLLLDVTDEEGYGVVIGDDETDVTIVMGSEDGALNKAEDLFDAIVNEYESLEEKLWDKLTAVDLDEPDVSVDEYIKKFNPSSIDSLLSSMEKREVIDLAISYDQYIIDHETEINEGGWVPVSLSEFYHNEFKEFY